MSKTKIPSIKDSKIRKKSCKTNFRIKCDLNLDSIVDALISIIEMYTGVSLTDSPVPSIQHRRYLLASFLKYELVKRCQIEFPQHNASLYSAINPNSLLTADFPGLVIQGCYIEYVIITMIYDVLDKHINFDLLSDCEFNKIVSSLRRVMKLSNIEGAEIPNDWDDDDAKLVELRRKLNRVQYAYSAPVVNEWAPDPNKCFHSQFNSL